MATKEFERIFLLLVIAAVSKVAQGEACVKMCDRGTLCVTRYVLCDGLSDCQDLADEANCKVDDCDGLTCPDGKCIRNDQYCDGHIDCTDQTDEIGCTKENYRQNHPSLTDENLCVMPCDHGVCKFDAKDFAFCKCKTNFRGLFCEIQSVPKIETTTDLRFSDNYDESTTLEYRHKMLVSAIESVPRVDDPVEHQTGLLPQVNVGDTLWPKSELDDPLSKNEAGESSVVSVVVTFLIVVAGVGVLLWTLVLKPCYKQQYDNTV
ncbi:low-density lipoprotein receptor-related protein 1B isoform X1 [Tropilaelaps mercedesae]|uniref:Low-density lipoprotein receptor-related protein 1B isoform X1 n=1 Tax=Tropilaelaps mercedesae TaxID=418985 RepID=A0A1V9XNT8_9ACAR|nr:low-density lipoprotein receptor-related protein 1B isoform X1 [Tropilaelaps mercedesae]